MQISVHKQSRATTYIVAQKSKLQTFVHIFAKYKPIFKLFSPAHYVENL